MGPVQFRSNGPGRSRRRFTASLALGAVGGAGGRCHGFGARSPRAQGHAARERAEGPAHPVEPFLGESFRPGLRRAGGRRSPRLQAEGRRPPALDAANRVSQGAEAAARPRPGGRAARGRLPRRSKAARREAPALDSGGIGASGWRSWTRRCGTGCSWISTPRWRDREGCGGPESASWDFSLRRP